MRSHQDHNNSRIVVLSIPTTVFDFPPRTEERFNELEFSDYGRDQPLGLGWWLVPVILLGCAYIWIATLLF
jgi:hypothetical protein